MEVKNLSKEKLKALIRKAVETPTFPDKPVAPSSSRERKP